MDDFEKFGPIRRQEMSGIAIATSRNMVLSASTIPHVWVQEKVDITDRGLLVPVIRDTDQRSLTDIAVELTRISKEAKERKTKLDDLERVTFTISNLGGSAQRESIPSSTGIRWLF